MCTRRLRQATLLTVSLPPLPQVAPAMNTFMWDNPLTGQQLEALRLRGIGIIPPVAKTLACGDTGMGAMASPADIVAAVVAALQTNSHPCSQYHLPALTEASKSSLAICSLPHTVTATTAPGEAAAALAAELAATAAALAALPTADLQQQR